MNSVRASINCSAEIPLSKASPSQRWKVSIWALSHRRLIHHGAGAWILRLTGQGGESGVCVLFWKGIHCAPPIRLNYRIKKPAFAGFILFVVRDYRRDGVILA